MAILAVLTVLAVLALLGWFWYIGRSVSLGGSGERSVVFRRFGWAFCCFLGGSDGRSVVF